MSNPLMQPTNAGEAEPCLSPSLRPDAVRLGVPGGRGGRAGSEVPWIGGPS